MIRRPFLGAGRRMTAGSATVSLGAVVVAFYMSAVAFGDMIDAHFVIADASKLGYSSFGSPSTNELGDVVVRAVPSAGLDRNILVWFSNLEVQPDGRTVRVYEPATTVDSRPFSTPFPLINYNRSVVGAYAGTGTDASQGFVERYDYTAGQAEPFSPVRIAHWDTQARPEVKAPFRDIALSVSLDDAGEVGFNNRTTALGFGVFAGSKEVTDPASSALATTTAAFTSLDKYVDGGSGFQLPSGRLLPGGWVIRGTTTNGDTGIFRVTTSGGMEPVATKSTGFTASGRRPAINNLGTVAFQGTTSANHTSVFLDIGGRLYDSAAWGTIPTAFSDSERVAINDFNQVAYLGTDAQGRQAIFSTNLGATREIIAVGDWLPSNDPKNPKIEVTGLGLYAARMARANVTPLCRRHSCRRGSCPAGAAARCRPREDYSPQGSGGRSIGEQSGEDHPGPVKS
jgi:hypothetical protein